MDVAVEKSIRKWALDNARKYGGKANQGAVISKVINEFPEIKSKLKEIMPEVSKIIKELNKLGVEKQTSEIEKIAPELLEKKKEDKKELPELTDAIAGKVVTRIPPEPSKYIHIGHALSFLINYLYAKKYNGKCVLRFEDTNPEKCSQEFVDDVFDGLRWLNIVPDKITYSTNDMDEFYKNCEKLIKKEKAYACFCKTENMRTKRFKGEECECRTNPVEKNFDIWKKMLDRKFNEEDVCIRLKGDMKHPNGTMRDPVLFRISYTSHFKHKEKYCIWPLYDIGNAVEDDICGITHIFRSSEFMARENLQNYLKELLDLKKQNVVEYGRFGVMGATTKGREIRELIEQGKVIGWDDPRLVTIKALKRRGIVPETVHELVFDIGMKKDSANIDPSFIAAINRKILDSKVSRFFFIANPKKITIKNTPEQTVEINFHPDHKEWGKRIFKTNNEFFIAEDDLKILKSKKLYRLMECCNFVKNKKDDFTFDSKEVDNYKKKGEKIMHWLPCNDKLVKAEILMNDASVVSGLAESGVSKLNVSDIIQFERFGFCRLDKIENGVYRFWFSHK